MQLSGLASGRSQARLVDFGVTVDCHLTSDLFSAVHIDVPSFAYHCALHGADERPAAAVANMMKQYMTQHIALVARVSICHIYREFSTIKVIIT